MTVSHYVICDAVYVWNVEDSSVASHDKWILLCNSAVNIQYSQAN